MKVTFIVFQYISMTLSYYVFSPPVNQDRDVSETIYLGVDDERNWHRFQIQPDSVNPKPLFQFLKSMVSEYSRSFIEPPPAPLYPNPSPLFLYSG